MQIRFSVENYYNELGRLSDCPEELINLLRDLVRSHLFNVDSPEATPRLIALVKEFFQDCCFVMVMNQQGNQKFFRIMLAKVENNPGFVSRFRLVEQYPFEKLMRLEEL